MIAMQNRCPTATVKDACDFLGISRTTLYQMMWRGELQTLKIRGSRRFRWEDLESLVNGVGVHAKESH